MLTIQINPNLQKAVHTLKNVDVRENKSLSITELSLSKEESSALISTFNRPATRKTDLLEPRSQW
ncbi:hypothetical protein [Paenibacillus sp. RC67]|uniref:hypothetical protein n=1 Tax=Paenibacillus sp. RC67 TaxID=3039392 RepID=UPI0024ADD4B5|nr:hypothetical protein [Paenibacillus sp. RC67]